ncbi:MAG: Spy/CpxP family protein refolding chaperone [Alphaproteobacteria bacterium]|nr:Spy/CpxP family protein refolding chaperone [Alphaproteobacteria bacterium]
MKHKPLFVFAFGLLVVGAATAQTPYAGMQSRPIKALSDEQVADLRAGRGMGLALAAELNGYPGPAHLLELADQLDLSDEQRTTAQRLFDSMKAESIPIGERLIAQEADLDRLFAEHKITPENLATVTAEIGETQAKLRDAHLKYHLATVALLRPSQIQRYAVLRGYSGIGQEHQHHN